MADGRGEASHGRTRWLWLPGEDGRVTRADPADLAAGLTLDRATHLATSASPNSAAPALPAVRAG